MAVKKINPVVTQDFLTAGSPEIITANKGVQAISIQGNEFIKYEQQRFPTGNTWIAIEQVVMPTTDFIPQGTTNFYITSTQITQLGLLTQDILDALTGANLPSAANVFATMTDVLAAGSLFAVLTVGNDGGGLDIQDVAAMRDSLNTISIDIQNRQLINSAGLVWTIDWNNRLTGDSAGQFSIDWENRLLIDNVLATKFDWQNLTMPDLAGVGTRMVTADAGGVLSTAAIPAGTVTSVSGTLNRVTSTGGANPVIDIDVAYDALWQPVDADLSAIAALGFLSTSFLTKTGVGTWALDTNTYLANPMTTLGDIIYEDAVPAPNRLAGNTTATKKFLTQTGTGLISAVPVWDTIAAGDIPDLSGTYQPLDADLTAIAALGFVSTSFLIKTAANTWALDTNTYLTSVTAHDVLSATHGDTLAAAVVLGDIIHGNGTPKWTRLAGNITTTKKFLTQTGTGAISAVPAWDTIAVTDIPSLTSAQLATILSDETGTGLVVFNNSPVFVDDITIGTVATGTGQIKLLGTTSGTVTLSVADAAGTWTLKLPADDGTPSQFLQTDGAGNTIWATGSATVGDADYGDVTVSGVGTIWTVDSFTTANEAVDTTCFPLFVNAAATAGSAAKTNTSLTFDASIARLGSASFVGAAFLTSAANPATTGTFRMANTGAINWRNAASSTQYGISLDASDIFQIGRATTIAGIMTSTHVSTGNVYPTIDDGGTLGLPTTNQWSDAYFATGAVLYFNAIDTITHSTVFTSTLDIVVPDEAYGVGWDTSLEVPTKNAVYDKIQSLATGLPAGFIFGCIMSNDAGDTTNDIAIAAGKVRDESDTEDMTLSAIVKRIDAAWAVGTGNGGMNTGAVAISTWYEVHVIKRTDTGVVDVMFTTTANRATLPTNYDKQRRIGWVMRDGAGVNLQFTQINDYFTLTTPQNDVSATATASATTRTLTAPPSTLARFRAACLGNTSVNAANGIVFSEIVETDTAPTTTNGFLSIGAGDFAIMGTCHVELRVSTTSTIRDRAITATGSMAYDASTYGWVDNRLRLSATG